MLIIRLISLTCALSSMLGASYAQNQFVFEIKTSECTNEPRARVQSGFQMKGVTGIVTALHGVADCRFITAKSDGSFVLHDPLQLLLVDVDRDVAVLTSRELSVAGDRGFDRLTSSVSAHTAVILYGHPYGLSALSTHLFTRSTPLVPLMSLLPPGDTAYAFQARNSPNPLVNVISTESGNILPGHSGAPLVDTSGKVVGMADGGLRGGTVQIAWAIPIADLMLHDMTKDRQRLAVLQQAKASELFSFDVPGDDDDSRRSRKQQREQSLDKEMKDGENAEWLDNDTGLLWSLEPPGDKWRYHDAEIWCKQYRGSSGYRLPTMKQLNDLIREGIAYQGWPVTGRQREYVLNHDVHNESFGWVWTTSNECRGKYGCTALYVTDGQKRRAYDELGDVASILCVKDPQAPKY